MITNKDRFDSEHQYEIAKEALDQAFIDKFGEDDELLNDLINYEEYIDRILYESDETAFHGTDEEIREIWYDLDIFG